MPESATRPILAYRDGALAPLDDAVAMEEPLEIRLNGEPLAITMRTPGADLALAAGFLHGEGLLPDVAALATAGPALPDAGRPNVVELTTPEPVDAARVARSFYATSSCGVCGKSSLKAVAAMANAGGGPVDAAWTVAPGTLLALPDRLRAAQATFELTGSLHAAALVAPDGTLLDVREDVGRHNAVDKVIGARLLAGRLPVDDALLLVSGRTSFEIVQKAVMARIPLVVAISGPSTLAVDLAERFGVTLVGFLRGGRFNVYAHPRRIDANGTDRAGASSMTSPRPAGT